ncbi:isoprenylcysteine carboxylmethyltransferase family protein [Subsaximicrobium wynnwilliamsii]|uniref:Isoprenylcysteine carboxylmethyltransferase family protein n=2 Tax=Subsaximicrobium wynnwilliamsii TaxID=291179 RepID=A0A5C6ZLL7_9FLAO|nr:isoprenylcysteine carboxylmethyltransferase family protein [Subsaximicrobium wynnwilliamsii]TXD90307.1 isoprenylcysteine carboxylmethyltransferase family protein [Subsaximicrobium wynnwilliamsii]TXE04358.1 isoprenylcysteine carboxylmethyltransferase family protein [Subsaximicrobium wynnwilliamsii]
MVQLLIFVVYFLPIQLITIELPEWLSHLGLFILWIGLLFGIVALLQLNNKLSPFPSPVAAGKLITNGAFRISRHPIYTALIFSGFGYAVYQSSVYKILIAVLLLILFYFKSRYEEGLLSKKFSEYQNYKKRTRRFIGFP